MCFGAGDEALLGVTHHEWLIRGIEIKKRRTHVLRRSRTVSVLDGTSSQTTGPTSPLLHSPASAMRSNLTDAPFDAQMPSSQLGAMPKQRCSGRLLQRTRTRNT